MLKDITLGQYYQTDSVIHRLDPRVKLVSTVVFIISLFIVDNFIGYLIAAAFLFAVIKLSKVPFSFMVRGMKSILILLLFAVVFNLFLTPGEVLVSFWKLTITKEGLRLAVLMAVRLSFLIIGSSVMTLTTTPNNLTDGMENLMNPLRKLKVPVHEIAMMMSIALRFIPTLAEEMDKITKAQKAREYFKEAATALLESGAYKEGDVIELEITWQSQLNVDLYQGPIEKYWLEAFNHPSVCDGKLTLAVKEYVPAVWTDAYYAKMMVGQYDLGFGGVNGNPLNPLNFLEVLKSDNSSGFTLNWGPDTNKPSQDLIWNDQAWSFDALWQAAETGGYFKDGLYVPNHNVEKLTDGVKNEDGTVTYTFKTNIY